MFWNRKKKSGSGDHKHSEAPLSDEIREGILGAAGDGLSVLGLTGGEPPEQIMKAIDEFVDAWQLGKRPTAAVLDPDDAPFALAALWGRQMEREFGWEWGTVTFHEHGDTSAPGVMSQDRAAAIFPIHFLMGALNDPDVDMTGMLVFNMIKAGKMDGMKPGEYVNLMAVAGRIVPGR